MVPKIMRKQAGLPIPKRKPALNTRYPYRTVKVGHSLWKLYEHRVITTKRKNKVMRWVCVAIGTKHLQDIAFKLNLFP